MTSPMSRIAVTLALVAGVFVACASPDITAPVKRTAQTGRLLGLGDNLVECPSSDAATSSAIVTPLGGVVSAGGTTISIPAGALLSAATVTVTVPASNLMEVDISVEGTQHFIFESPVTVTLSYARCARGNLDKAPLTVWHIDSETKALLEPMGGIDDKLLRTVTFITGHLSGYAVAN